MQLSSNKVENRNYYTQLTVKLPPLTLSSGSVPVCKVKQRWTVETRTSFYSANFKVRSEWAATSLEHEEPDQSLAMKREG